MKIKFVHSIILVGLCLLLTIAFGYPAQAAPSKDAIDSYAKANGFPRSDYPYYEPVNQCGGEGATSAVPDKYEVAITVPDPSIGDPFGTKRVVIFRADFNNACNNHDRCYMTAGKAREECEAQFSIDLLSACRNPVVPDPASVVNCVKAAETYAKAASVAGAAFYPDAQDKAKRYNDLVQAFTRTAIRVTICNRIPSTATFFLNSDLKSMAGGKCGGYTLPAGSQFKTSYSKAGRRIEVLVNLEGGTYDLVKDPSGDIELRRT